MSKRFDNKKLLYLLAGLIAILLLTYIIRIPGEKATFKSRIVEFDTLAVNKIVIYPLPGKGDPIEFSRKNSKWSVQQGTIVSATQKGAVDNIFSEVLSLKPQSLASINKSKWKEFHVSDSLATRVKVLDKKGKTLADLMIGKFSYKQVDNAYGGYGRNNVQGTSYIRLFGDKEVYAVDGFISFFFNGNFEYWRDKTLVASNINDVTNIRFTYPGDSSYTLIKKESVWYSGNQIADSLKVADFLNGIKNLDGQDINDNFKPVENPEYQVLIEGNNLLNISVKCYKTDNNVEYCLNSSLNPDIFFTSKKNDIFDKLFKPQNHFLKKTKKK